MNESDTKHPPPAHQPRQTASNGLLVHVVTDNATTLQDELEEAVRTVRESEPQNRQGIMITRHSEALFTVTHSPDVPCGTTLEQDHWHRHP